MNRLLRSARAWVLAVLAAILLVSSFAVRQAPAAAAPDAPPPAAGALQQFRAGDHILGASAAGVTIAAASHALRIEFAGARAVEPRSSQPARPQAGPLEQVSWEELWPGISLAYRSAAGGIAESIYTLAPGAAAAEIRLRYNVPVQLNADGSLSAAFAGGQISESAPQAWQEIGGQRRAVEAAFRLGSGGEVGFALGSLDPAYPVTIDPVITWVSFLGGNNANEQVLGIAADAGGNVYLTGYSAVSWGSPKLPFSLLTDAFVARFNSDGSRAWSTFLGGTGMDLGYGIGVDGSGHVFVCGRSDQPWGDLPVSAYAGNQDLFAASLNASTGALLWHTFLGSAAQMDSAQGLAVSSAGDVFLTGSSGASWGSPKDIFPAGSYNAFVAKLSGATGDLLWNTFAGGPGTDQGTGIAVNSAAIYVTGTSDATWGDPFPYTYKGGQDAFVAKFNLTTGALIWNVFHGGALGDTGNAIALDPDGYIYIGGETGSSWGLNPVHPYSGAVDGYAARLDANGFLNWHTFVGQTANDGVFGVAADGNGNVYLTGYSYGGGWGSPLRPFSGTAPAFAAVLTASSGALTWNTFLNGATWGDGRAIAVRGSDLFVGGASGDSWGSPLNAFSSAPDLFAAKMGLNTILIWNTFAGGSADDFIEAIAVDASGNTYVAGFSNLKWYVPPHAPVRDFTGKDDAFVAKLDPGGAELWNTFLGGARDDHATGIALDGAGSVFVTGYSEAAWGSNTKRSYTAGLDAFAAKLDGSTGAMLWNTFLGGTGSDSSNAIFADSNGESYVTGYSNATWGLSPKRAYNVGLDAFAARLDSSGVLGWNTFLGGAGTDVGAALAVNSSAGTYQGGYVVGTSSAAWGGLPAPTRPYSAGVDVFLARLNMGDGTLLFYAFYGGAGSDEAAGLVIDSTQNLYIAGDSSAEWSSPPTATTRAYSSGTDTFVVRVDATTGYVYMLTFMGGPGNEYAAGIARDEVNNIYVAGTATAPWGASARPYGGNWDAFVTGLNDSGWLNWNLFLGGSSTDFGSGIAVDPAGMLYASGYSYARWAQGVNAYTGGWDGFVTKLDPKKYSTFTPLLRK